jgi:hypothetical protein
VVNPGKDLFYLNCCGGEQNNNKMVLAVGLKVEHFISLSKQHPLVYKFA